MGVSFCQRGFA
ncbi:hypothetical protein SAMN02746000_00088 [Paracoccus sp. J56]|nr:hypothetical protein SAMN02746000_00088 [Paracoccus sp. J56]